MTIAAWVGNSAAIQQIETCTVSAIATGGVLSATINSKVISYTVLSTDTIASAITAWLALLSNTAVAPPEFNEQTWGSTATTITATATVPGTPFAGMTNGLVFSGSGGCTVTQTHTQANSSPSDVFDAKNWLRNGVPGLPQDGDDMVIANSQVPLLWNLDKLLNVRLNSITVWMDAELAIGLPYNNPLGYTEYRPLYFKLLGPSGSSSSSGQSSAGGSGTVLNVEIGYGQNGNGPTRVQFDFQGQQYAAFVMNGGQPDGAYVVRLLGTNAANTIKTIGTPVGVAMWPAETATLASASAGSGGLLALGPGVTFSGQLTIDTQSFCDLNCTPNPVLVQNGSQLAQGVQASRLSLTYQNVTLKNGSAAVWLSGSKIEALTMETGSTLDKSQDLQPMTVTSATVDSNCVVNDPNSVMTWTNAVRVKNQVSTGWLRTGPDRTWKVT